MEVYTKVCSGCSEDKNIEEFDIENKETGKRRSKCKKCCSLYYHKYKGENGDRLRQKWRKASQKYDNTKRSLNKRLKRYGITIDDYNKLYDEQSGLCKICGKNVTLCVDHCHNSSLVRGLLCNSCNVGLGCFEDNIERLNIAIEYLKGGKVKDPASLISLSEGGALPSPATNVEPVNSSG